VRTAIGASRGRLVRALVGEHAALAAGGGLLGALLAAGLVRAFAALAPADLPRVADLGPDWSLVWAAALVTTLVVLVAGVAPAAAATRVAPAAVLGGARQGAGGTAADVRARRLLVGAQVAMALVVLAGAALVGRSLAGLAALDLGMPAADRLALVELVATPPPGGWGDSTAVARWRATVDAVAARTRAAPGVVAVALAVQRPYSGPGGWDVPLTPGDAAPGDAARRPFLNMEVTNGDYLLATGVPLLGGRWLSDAADRREAPRVVALSARAARALFPGVRAAAVVGRRVRAGDQLLTVVGVVGDTRYREFLEPRPSVYFPYAQVESPPSLLVVRTQGDPLAAVGAVRRAAAEVAPAVLAQATGTMRTLAAAPLARPRLLAAVLGDYAVVVVALAVGGLYAVAAGSVAGRRREFGVRSAVGATPGALASLVVGEGLRVAGVGAAVGLGAALAGGRLLAASLYGVAPTDAVTLGLATVALLGVCAAAVFVPARRAAQADPARVLRTE
jgi:predicted permease